jgi:peptidoglycan/xylan/chitin deacetylase (PgdA/CDA1 family)
VVAANMLALLGLPAAGWHSNEAGAATEQDVPILMYHVIAEPPADAPFPDLYVSPEEFADEMTWLAKHRFRAVTLEAVYEHWTKGSPLPSRPIVLSFDDGYRSVYRNALPILKSRHWPGVVNLTLSHTRVPWGLTDARVRRLVRSGWEIDSHTLTHADLTHVAAGDLRREVAGSRQAIRKRFGVPADFFCYPAGRYNATVLSEVRRAGYLGATTTVYGLARPSELFVLRRVRVNRGDGARGLGRKLAALGAVQG